MNVSFGIKDVEIFVKIIDCGSFKEAASELHVTQSALTQRLKKLEDTLGARLIDRTTRTVAATAVGLAFLPSARRLVGQFEQAVSDIRDVIGVTGGRVTLASLISVATYIMPSVIEQFAAVHPNVGVRVVDVAEQEILAYVRRGDVEFAIDMQTGDSDPDLVITPLMEDRFVLACRADHPLAAGGAVDSDALADMPLLTLGARSGTSRVLQAHLAERPRSANWLYEVQHLSTMVGYLEAGLGVGIVPSMVMRGLASRQLVSRPLTGPGLVRTLVFVQRRGVTLSPAAVALKQIVLAEFADLSRS